MLFSSGGQSQAVQEVSIGATVIRCVCGDPASHPEAVCPQGRVEPHGTISYYHRNLLKRWAWAIRHKFGRQG